MIILFKQNVNGILSYTLDKVSYLKGCKGEG